MTTPATQKQAKIAYLLNAFPTLSETFIINEVVGLRNQGVDLDVFALFKPPDDKVNEAMADLQKTTFYLMAQISGRKLVQAHVFFLFHYPLRYLKTARFAIQKRSKETSLFGILLKSATRGEYSKDQRQDLFVHFILAVVLARRMWPGEYTFLFAHFADAAASLAMLISRLLGIPYGISVHAYDIFTPQRNWREKFFSADLLVTCTHYNREYMLENFPYLTAERIQVVYHGIDVQRFTPTRRKRAHPPVILSIGRLVPKKGFASLIEASKILHDRGFDFRCIIIGEGPERPRLEMRIKLGNLEDVVCLTGSVQPSEIVNHYADATIFALPCIVEENGNRDGIPNVIAEAMAMQLPVVSSPISGIPELLVDGKTGLLVAEADCVGVADALQRLLESPGLRARLGKAARRQVESIFVARQLHSELAKILLHAAG